MPNLRSCLGLFGGLFGDPVMFASMGRNLARLTISTDMRTLAPGHHEHGSRTQWIPVTTNQGCIQSMLFVGTTKRVAARIHGAGRRRLLASRGEESSRGDSPRHHGLEREREGTRGRTHGSHQTPAFSRRPKHVFFVKSVVP